jgi:hypothetical protein
VEQRAASRSYDLELCRDSNRSLAIARVKPPRWWRGSGVGVNEIFFFNKRLDLPAGAWLTTPQDSLCVVNDQPVGNPKRKV